LRLLIRKLEEAYNRQVEIEKQLRKELAAKAGADQGRADAEAALDAANDEISQANAQIRELSETGKGLCDRAVIAAHRNSAATTFEIAKGIVVLALIFINFRFAAQGMIHGILWAGMLVWSYIASVTVNKQRTTENIWFLVFAALSCLLLHRYILIQTGLKDDTFLRLFSGTGFLNCVVYICVILSGFLMTSHSWWRKRRIDDDAADSEIRAEYSAFNSPSLFPQVEITKGSGKIEQKPSADDEGREELYRGHEYLHILSAKDTLPDDMDAKIIYDSREDDPENGMIVFSVPNLDKLEQLQKHPDRKEKTTDKGKQKSGLDRQ